MPRSSEQTHDVIAADDQDDQLIHISSEDDPGKSDDALRVYTHQEGDFDFAGELKPRRSSTKSFVTASSVPPTAANDHGQPGECSDSERGTDTKIVAQASGLQVLTDQEGAGHKSRGKRPASTVNSPNTPTSTLDRPSVDAESTSSLLRKADVNKAPAEADVGPSPPAKGILAKVKRKSESAVKRSDSPTDLGSAENHLTRKKSTLRNLVKFDIPEDSRRAKVHLKAKQAQMTIQRVPSRLRRQRLADGLVVKMERMLVRVDAAGDVPDDFDENVNQRVASRVKDKWREYMIVCRHSHKDGADFVLQLYNTRVYFVLR